MQNLNHENILKYISHNEDANYNKRKGGIVKVKYIAAENADGPLIRV
jgi:hypothetical protein